MGSARSTTIGTVVGFFLTLIIAFGLLYAASFGLLPTIVADAGGMIPVAAASGFASSTILQQLYTVYNGVLLNIMQAYIIASIIWLLGGFIGGLITRDAIRGAAVGLIAAIITPFLTWIIYWGVFQYPDFSQLISSGTLALLLNWVINGILGGIIAAVGGVIGGTLTSLTETR